MNEKLLDSCNTKITYSYIKYLEKMNKKPDFSVDEFIISGKSCNDGGGEEKINEVEKQRVLKSLKKKKDIF